MAEALVVNNKFRDLDPIDALGYVENKDYSQTFLSQLSGFLENEIACDIAIKINDQKIHAHKLILAAGSPYFSMCFFGKLAGQQKIDINEIKLDELKFSSVEKIIQYFYSSRIKINDETVHDLFKAADFLQIEWIREKCAAYIRKILTISNCIDFWSFTESLCADQLSSEILMFILGNLTEISMKPKFLLLGNEKMQQIISHKSSKINIKALYLAVIKWTKHDVENRRSIFNELVEMFPFTELDKLFINAHLENEDLIVSDVNCLKLFSDAVSNCLRTHINIDQDTMAHTADRNFVKKDKSAFDIFVYATYDSSKTFCQFYNPKVKCDKKKPESLNIYPFGAIVPYKDYICFSGGIFNSSALTVFNMYNIFSNHWITAKAMLTAKKYHGMIVCNDALYACDVNFGLERFDICTNIWNKVEITSPNVEAFGDKHISADVLDGRIFGVGGNKFSNESILHTFDPREGQWQHEINHRGIGSILNFHDNLYLSSTNYSYLLNYDLRNKKLIPAFSPLPHLPVFGLSLTCFGNSIYLFEANETGNVSEFNSLLNEWMPVNPLMQCCSYIRAAVVPQITDIF